jgi:hypothetical protein
MQKSSIKLYLSTLLLTLTLASFGFAGDIQCPLAPPPPPPPEGGRAVTVIANTNPSEGDTYQFLKGFWEILAQSRNLF